MPELHIRRAKAHIPYFHTVPQVGLLAGPLLAAFLVLFFDLEPGRPEVTRTAAVALWMAVWWLTEAIPLAVTAMLPVVLFPFLGVMSGKAVAPLYFNSIIFLFVGGFIVALAMQRWNLHKRLALRILLLIGIHPRALLLGFMVATAFLSMWISNTASTMMMVPIALAIVLDLEETLGGEVVSRYAKGLFLGVAYGATLGGIATLVGTPPNLVFVKIFSITFPKAPEVSFAAWFAFAFPVSVVFLLLVWLVLSSIYGPPKDAFSLDRGIFEKEYEALGPISYEERVVLVNFVILAVLWLFRGDITIGRFTLPGWSTLFSTPAFLDDGTVAILIATLLFVIPARGGEGGRIMDWETATRLPWNIVLLFGGGFALARGFKYSGLSLWLGDRLAALSALHPLLIVAAICLLLTFLTELTSNTATSQLILPVIAALAVQIRINPLFLMIPGTLSCSCAFMLPVATPPNAIVFGTGRLRIADMAKVGVGLNFLGVVIITAAIYFVGTAVFGIDLARTPGWAVMR
jgi:sodium-dependent dicarboxylate transporter 2/3/5